MRRSQAEKIEIIHLVEHSELSISKTLEELDVPRSTFYRWYRDTRMKVSMGWLISNPAPDNSGTGSRT